MIYLSLLHTIFHNAPFCIGEDLLITPLEVIHGRLPVIAYRFNDFAYATDLNFISDETIERLQGLDVLVLDCVRIKPHATHLGLNEALEYIERIDERRSLTPDDDGSESRGKMREESPQIAADRGPQTRG